MMATNTPTVAPLMAENSRVRLRWKMLTMGKSYFDGGGAKKR